MSEAEEWGTRGRKNQIRKRLNLGPCKITEAINSVSLSGISESRLIITTKVPILFESMRLILLPASAITEISNITLEIINPFVTESIAGWPAIVSHCALLNTLITDYQVVSRRAPNQVGVPFVDIFDFCRRNNMFAINGVATLMVTLQYSKDNPNREVFVTNRCFDIAPEYLRTSLVPHYSYEFYTLPVETQIYSKEKQLLEGRPNIYAIGIAFTDENGNSIKPTYLSIKNILGEDITSKFTNDTDEFYWGSNTMMCKPDIKTADLYLPASFMANKRECKAHCAVVFKCPLVRFT